VRCIAALLALTLICPVAAWARRNVTAASKGCALPRLESGRGLEPSMLVDGVRRAYILDVPETIAPGQPVPLLLDFHGFQHSAIGVWQVSEFKALAPQAQFITVYPDGLPVHLLDRDGAGWEIFSVQNNHDVRFVNVLLDALEQTYCVDRHRIYSTGFSNGAFFSNLLGCVLSDRIAAIAPVAGGRFTVPCRPKRPLPVIIHHGRNDPLVPVAQAHTLRDEWNKLDHCRKRKIVDGCELRSGCRDGVAVEYCEDDSSHHWPPAASERIWKFLSNYSLKQ